MRAKEFSKLAAIAAVVLLVLLAISMTLAGCLSSGGSKDGTAYSADVIIVGAGGAGMSAIIEATKAGASVIVLEKTAVLGGNTLPAMSGLTAVGSDVQIAAGVGLNVFTIDDYVKRHVNNFNNPELVRRLAEKSADTVRWLEDMGLVLKLASTQGEGRMMHEASGPGGQAIVPILSENVKKSGAVFFFNTTATDLIYQNGQVTGVEAVDAQGNKIQFMGNAVVLATGGYARDNALVAQYRPEFAGIWTDEIAPTTGEGLKMAQKIGADYQDLDQFQPISKVEIFSHDMILPGHIAENSIFVNYQGRRFLKEGAAPGESQVGLADKVIAMPVDKKVFYYVFDSEILENHSGVRAFYNRRLTVQGATPGELAGKLGIDPVVFENTIGTWNSYFETNPAFDKEFGRSSGMTSSLSHPPYYAIRACTGIHYCMGGIKINPENQVLATDGRVIPGLYAAGEVTGGVHGSERVEGTAVTDTLAYGRQAGQNAAVYAASFGKVKLIVSAPARVARPAIAGSFANGVHSGTGMGRNGPLTVSVTVANGNIAEIKFVSQTETPTMYDAIERELIPAVINAQSLKVDAVSGATITTVGVLEAIADALGI